MTETADTVREALQLPVHSSAGPRRGVALLIVLVTTAVMGALSTEFAYNTRTNIWMAGNVTADTQAFYHARSAATIGRSPPGASASAAGAAGPGAGTCGASPAIPSGVGANGVWPPICGVGAYIPGGAPIIPGVIAGVAPYWPAIWGVAPYWPAIWGVALYWPAIWGVAPYGAAPGRWGVMAGVAP